MHLSPRRSLVSSTPFFSSLLRTLSRDGPSAAAAPSAGSSSGGGAASTSEGPLISSSPKSHWRRSGTGNASSSGSRSSAAAMRPDRQSRCCSVTFRSRRAAPLRAGGLHARGQRRVLGDSARLRTQARARYRYAKRERAEPLLSVRKTGTPSSACFFSLTRNFPFDPPPLPPTTTTTTKKKGSSLPAGSRPAAPPRPRPPAPCVRS